MTKRSRLLDWTLRCLPGLAFAAVIYAVTGGKFTIDAGRHLLWALFIGVCFGLPLFWLFRVGIRWLAFWSRAKGYGATAVGVILTFTLLIALIHVVPRSIGMFCFPPGLIGGICGSLEAKDKSMERRATTVTP